MVCMVSLVDLQVLQVQAHSPKGPMHHLCPNFNHDTKDGFALSFQLAPFQAQFQQEMPHLTWVPQPAQLEPPLLHHPNQLSLAILCS